MPETSVEVPEKFYKYRPMSNDLDVKKVEDIVQGSQIYFARADSFNDPFDLRPVFSLQASPERHREDFLRLSKKFEPYLTERQRIAEADRVMTDAMSQENIDMSAAVIQMQHNQFIREQVGVFCVTTKRDDLLMWAHYAGSHSGICIEFDGMSKLMAHAQPVCYSGERIPINPYEDSHDVMLDKALFTKSEHWAYEDEWRLLRYEGGPGPVEFRPHNLTGIIFGALASSATIEMVLTWVRQRSTPVNLYRASVSSKKFELVIKPVRLG